MLPATRKFFGPEIEKTKQIVKKYQIPITVAATAVTTVVIFKGVHNAPEKFYEAMYNSMRNTVERGELEFVTVLEFLEEKGLSREFEMYNHRVNR